jgi:hypothetical protein
MSDAFYKGLGVAVWKGGLWYVRRHSGGAPRRFGAAVLGAAVLGGVALALRRNARAEA